MITLYEDTDRYFIVDPDKPILEIQKAHILKADITQAKIDAYVASGNYEVTPYSEWTAGWEFNRRQPTADGGYGTWWEQLEILGEGGETAHMAHCAAVKTAYPKP